VAPSDPTNHRDPLDPLRRFTPTPLRTRFRLGATRVMVHTNDFALLPALPLETAPVELDAPIFEWRLVRDYDAVGLLEDPLLLTSGTLTIAEMGAACLLGVDHERRELLCFFGTGIDARIFQEVLVPFFCSLMNDSAGASALGALQNKREGAIRA
jgi:hypothetical protein